MNILVSTTECEFSGNLITLQVTIDYCFIPFISNFQDGFIILSHCVTAVTTGSGSLHEVLLNSENMNETRLGVDRVKPWGPVKIDLGLERS